MARGEGASPRADDSVGDSEGDAKQKRRACLSTPYKKAFSNTGRGD